MARTKKPSKREIVRLFHGVPKHRKAKAIAKLMDMWERTSEAATADGAQYRSPAGSLYATKAAAETLDIILGLERHETEPDMAAVKLMQAIRESAKAEESGSQGGGVTINFVLEDDPKPDGTAE